VEENKNIDRLFQEKLKSWKAKPSEKVWTGIEVQLKKKKKRMLPFWWFPAGIAAALILGFLLFPFSTDENSLDNNNQNLEIITTSPENKIDEKQKNNSDFNATENDNIIQQEMIVSTKKPIINNSKSTEKKQEFIAENKNSSTEKKLENFTEKESNLDLKKAMKKIFKSETKLDSVDTKLEEKKIFLKPKKDFLASLNVKDSLKLDDFSSKKWSVSPSFAVLSSNSFTNNSSLDADLNTNSTSGKSTYSYGIKVAYEINNKWTIQSGIHLQEMGFSTKDVRISASLSKQTLANVNSDAQLKFNSLNTMQSADINTSKLANLNEQGELNQSFGYIEIPLEIKYNLSNSAKFKTEIVTGFSSLFLNKNSINLSSNSFSGNIGEANNLNNINFSGNLGLDFNYAVDKNLFLNLNPMFKAQLNTFSNNSNGFQPYFFGIYTGIKYQF